MKRPEEVEVDLQRFFEYFTNAFRRVFHPTRFIAFISKADTKMLIIQSIVLLLVVSGAVSLFGAGVSGKLSWTSSIKLSFRLPLLSLFFFLPFFASTVFLQVKFVKKVKIGFFLSLYMTPILLLPSLLSTLLYVAIEHDSLYYVSIFFNFIAAISISIIYPVLINTKWRRIVSTLVATCLFFFSSFAIAVGIQILDSGYTSNDPILNELLNQNVIESSRIDYLHARLSLMTQHMASIDVSTQESTITEIIDLANAICEKRESTELLLTKLRFDRNRDVPLQLLECMIIVDAIRTEIKQHRYIPEATISEIQELPIRISQKKKAIKEQQKRTSVLIGEIEILVADAKATEAKGEFLEMRQSDYTDLEFAVSRALENDRQLTEEFEILSDRIQQLSDLIPDLERNRLIVDEVNLQYENLNRALDKLSNLIREQTRFMENRMRLIFNAT